MRYVGNEREASSFEIKKISCRSSLSEATITKKEEEAAEEEKGRGRNMQGAEKGSGDWMNDMRFLFFHWNSVAWKIFHVGKEEKPEKSKKLAFSSFLPLSDDQKRSKVELSE